MKKIVYVGLLIACISFFSFKQICNDSNQVYVKQKLENKIIPAGQEEELNFFPLYNLLRI